MTGDRHDIRTLDDLDKLVGHRVRLSFYGWRYGKHANDPPDFGVLGRDGEWLTLDGKKTASFGPDGRRGTPYVRVRLMEVSHG